MLDLVIFDLETLLHGEADSPYEPTLAVFYDHFVGSRDMWILSHRSEAEREPIEDLLYRQGVYYNRILMRAAGDERDAVEMKMRWLRDGTLPRERILCAYANDAASFGMYRAEGIPCFHVLP